MEGTEPKTKSNKICSNDVKQVLKNAHTERETTL